MINELKSVCCFNIADIDNFDKQTIELKTNGSLDSCALTPYQYYTLSPETAETIHNTPWGVKPFPFTMEVLKSTDSGSAIQIINIDGEWRRAFFNNSLEGWWGKWVNIGETLDFILNNKDIQKSLTESWDRYMIINENNTRDRRWAGNATTIDKIIEEIKTGTAKIYLNKLIKK